MTTILSVNWEYIKISHFRSIEAYHSVFPFLYPLPTPKGQWPSTNSSILLWALADKYLCNSKPL